MRIGGIQKLTVQDYPGKVACIVFTEGCNFRCPFCHNGDLVLPGRLPDGLEYADLLAFLTKRAGLLDGLVISGGEPLMQPDAERLARDAKALGYAVKLDTNGSFPDRLLYFIEEGLVDYVAMDVKNAPSRYAETVGLPSFDLRPINRSVSLLLENRVPYEFRTTVVKEFHDLKDLLELARWIQGAEKYFLQGFEDAESVIQKGLTAYSQAELDGFAETLRPILPTVSVRGK